MKYLFVILIVAMSSFANAEEVQAYLYRQVGPRGIDAVECIYEVRMSFTGYDNRLINVVLRGFSCPYSVYYDTVYRTIREY